MRNLIAFPLLAFALILQTAIFSQIPLASGAVDLILLILVSWSLQPQVESAWQWAVLAGLMVTFVSGLPPLLPVFNYLIIAILGRAIQRRIWQSPIVSMLATTAMAIAITHFVTFIVLSIFRTGFNLQDVVAFVTLPTMFLNLLLAIPVLSVVEDIADWVYPQEGLL